MEKQCHYVHHVRLIPHTRTYIVRTPACIASSTSPTTTLTTTLATAFPTYPGGGRGYACKVRYPEGSERERVETISGAPGTSSEEDEGAFEAQAGGEEGESA